MKYLNLANTRITDESLAHFGRGLVQMRRLVLSDTTLSDAGIAHVHGFHELEELAVANTGVSDAGLATLTAGPSIHSEAVFTEHVALPTLAWPTSRNCPSFGSSGWDGPR